MVASYSAWSSDSFLIATIPAILGMVMAAQVAVAASRPRSRCRSGSCGLTWNQIHLVSAFQATIMMLAFLVEDSGFDKGIGRSSC